MREFATCRLEMKLTCSINFRFQELKLLFKLNTFYHNQCFLVFKEHLWHFSISEEESSRKYRDRFPLNWSVLANLNSNNITRPLVDLHILVALPRHPVGRPITVDPVTAARCRGRGFISWPGSRGDISLGLGDGPEIMLKCIFKVLTYILLPSLTFSDRRERRQPWWRPPPR